MVDDDPLAVDTFQSYTPIGDALEPGTFGSPFMFTGEMVDANDLVYLRARYYAPGLGVFTGLDPAENLNRYQYVSANPVNFVDPSGLIAEMPGLWNSCYRQEDPCAMYPGWTGEYWRQIYGDYRLCFNDRTLNPDFYKTTPRELQQWWSGLSATEKEIEEALTATNTDQCRSNARFDHIPDHTFDFVSGWISSNESTIREVSDKLNVDPALVAGILASEMLFDYDWTDQVLDAAGTAGIGIDPHGGYGNASGHEDAREAATNYIQQFIDSGAVYPVYPIGDADKQWLLMDYGAILTTAVIARWLVDPYIDQINIGYTTARVLSAEEMGVIFTAYRAGVGGWSPSDTYAFVNVAEYRKYPSLGLPCNAQLALPIMRYTKTIFS